MSDVELAALTAIVLGEIATMQAENKQREHLGQSMAYTDAYTSSYTILEQELKKRGVVQ